MAEWEAELEAVRRDILGCSPGSMCFGFPLPDGKVQPAVSIYAWNEFAEGGIIAPTQGGGYGKLRPYDEYSHHEDACAAHPNPKVPSKVNDSMNPAAGKEKS